MPGVKLKGSVASLDEVDAAYKDRYTKVGEVFVLGEIEIEDVSGLKQTVAATRKERDDAIAAAKKVEGVDLEAYNKWLTDKESADADALKKKGDWDAREAQLKKTHQSQLDAKDALLSNRDKALHSEMIESRARAALAAAGGNELFLLPHVTPALKIIEEGGAFFARVVDATGAVRVNSKGEPMSIAELVEEKKADTQFAGAFKASGAGGTGSDPAARGGNGGAIRTKADLRTDAEKSAYIHEHGSEKYLDLPAAAAK